MRLLIVSSRFPYPLEKGDKLRLYYQIQELSKHFEIVLLSLSDRLVSEEEKSVLKPYCKSIHVYQLTWPSILFNIIKGYSKGLPAQIAYFFDQKVKKQIDKLLEEEKPDHIYCQLIRASEYVKAQTTPKTLDFMDCFSLNSHKRAMHSNFWTKWFWRIESKRLKKYESLIYPLFDHHTIISTVDAQALALKTDQSLTTISNGIADRFFEKSEKFRDIDILFLGNLSYYSNVKAVEFFINEITPILMEKNKSLHIVIAGAHPSRKIKRWIGHHSPISLMADVPDTKEIYQRTKVFIAPITLGTGQQNKVLEAIASGCEVVCSAEVSTGLQPIAAHLSIARNSSEYAQIVIQKGNKYDQNNEIRIKAIERVRQSFNWEINTMDLVNLIKNQKK